MAKRQHKKPCGECPFRRVAPAGYLGGNDPAEFAIFSNRDSDLFCHVQVNKRRAAAKRDGKRVSIGKEDTAECAGRATMWANQLKTSRDDSVMDVPQDKVAVFTHIGEFIKHHRIEITPLELMMGKVK